MKLTLQAPGLDDLVLGESDDEFGLSWYDLGAPAPRELTQSAPDSDGTIDSSTLEGGRTISAIVQLQPWTFAAERRLKSFMSTSIRGTLLIDEGDDAPLLQATVRGVPFSVEVDVSRHYARVRSITCQWSVPSGVLESVELHETEVAAAAEVEVGVGFDWDFDLDFGDAPPVASIEVVNAGDRIAKPLLHVYGPWSGETRVENMTSGKALVFDDLALLDGEHLAIDVRNRTVTLNGDPAESRHNYLVFPDTDWWALTPGVNMLRFVPTTSTAPARLVIAWRDTYS